MKKAAKKGRPSKRPKYQSLGQLLDNRLTTDEHAPTKELIKELKHIQKTKCLTKRELEAICRWKSARALKHVRQNRPSTIRRLTTAAFTTRSERDKVRYLTSLSGVGLPMASAILMLTGPKRYGVIDIRVWKALFSLNSVRTKPGGAGFTFNNWYHYLRILRYHAKRLGVPVRVVERTLFLYHKDIQDGPLHKRRSSS